MEQALERRPWLTPVILAVLVLILFRPVVIPTAPGEVLAGKDLPSMFYPLQQYIAQTIKAGDLPLWNPHQFIGHPIVGNPHSGLLYPGMWFVWLVGVQRGIGLMMVLHAWFGAWGIARLVRFFGAGQVGSLLAGVIYGMSGWASAHFYPGHHNLMLILGWIPWSMAAYHVALQRGTWVALLPGAGVIGIGLLAGHPPLMIYMGFGLLAIWAYHVAVSDDMRRGAWWAGWRLAVIGIGGLLLGAALVLPAAELTGLATRESGDLAFASTYALPPAQFLSFIVPGLFGVPTEPPSYYWGADFFEEFTAYVGLLPLVALPLVLRRARRETWFFVGLIGFGLVLSMGVEGALMPLLVRWVPGFGMFRVPARALLLVVIGLAGLAAELVTTLQRLPLEERRVLLRPALRLWLPVGAAVAVGLGVFFAGWYASASHVEPMPQRAFVVSGRLTVTALIAGAVWVVLWLWTRPDAQAPRWALALTALLVIFDAWHVVIPVIPLADVNESPIWTGARTHIPATPGRVLMVAPYGGHFNEASVSGHLHVLGYDPLVIGTFDTLNKLGGDQGDPLSRGNMLLGVTYLLATEPYDDPSYELIANDYGSYYYRRVDPFPRAWVASDIVVEPNDTAALQRIGAADTNMVQTAFVDRAINCPAGEEAEAAITDYGTNDVTLTTSGGGGLLVLSDQYYPGWQATVDGKSADIVRTDTAFRGVCVPSGDHTVRFEYRPLSFYAGVVITGVSWLVWLVLAVIGWRRR